MEWLISVHPFCEIVNACRVAMRHRAHQLWCHERKKGSPVEKMHRVISPGHWGGRKKKKEKKESCCCWLRSENIASCEKCPSKLERKQFSAPTSNFYIKTGEWVKGALENGSDVHQVYFFKFEKERGQKNYSHNWLTKYLNGLIACTIK